MILRRAILALLLLPALAAAQTPAAQTPATPPRHPLLIEGKQSLYQRVIVRPGATLSAQPDGAGATPVPGFTVFYVYARPQGAPSQAPPLKAIGSKSAAHRTAAPTAGSRRTRRSSGNTR